MESMTRLTRERMLLTREQWLYHNVNIIFPLWLFHSIPWFSLLFKMLKSAEWPPACSAHVAIAKSQIQRALSPLGCAGWEHCNHRGHSWPPGPPTRGQEGRNATHHPTRGTSHQRGRIPAPAPEAGKDGGQEGTDRLSRCWRLQACHGRAGRCLAVGTAGDILSFPSCTPNTRVFPCRIKDGRSFKTVQLFLTLLGFARTAFRREMCQSPWD